MLFRHFAMERLLERLSVSEYKDDFVIKGGMLISSIVGIEERMTRDIDATMRGHNMDPGTIGRILSEVAGIDLGDGFLFEVGEPAEIMADSEYGGVRLPIKAYIEKSKTSFKIDVSTGDAITPDAVDYQYKLMFEERSIPLRSYNAETALAEKLETILSLATQTSRMRDFFDIWGLMRSDCEIDVALLGTALEATVATRDSTASLDKAEETILLMESSPVMLDLWERYQSANPFAESVSWDDALSALREMVVAIKENKR